MIPVPVEKTNTDSVHHWY